MICLTRCVLLTLPLIGVGWVCADDANKARAVVPDQHRTIVKLYFFYPADLQGNSFRMGSGRVAPEVVKLFVNGRVCRQCDATQLRHRT